MIEHGPTLVFIRVWWSQEKKKFYLSLLSPASGQEQPRREAN